MCRPLPVVELCWAGVCARVGIRDDERVGIRDCGREVVVDAVDAGCVAGAVADGAGVFGRIWVGV